MVLFSESLTDTITLILGYTFLKLMVQRLPSQCHTRRTHHTNAVMARGVLLECLISLICFNACNGGL